MKVETTKFWQKQCNCHSRFTLKNRHHKDRNQTNQRVRAWLARWQHRWSSTPEVLVKGSAQQGLCRYCPIFSPATSWSRPCWSPVEHRNTDMASTTGFTSGSVSMLSHFFTCHQLESSLLTICGTQTLHQQLVLRQGPCWCCPIFSPATSWSHPCWPPAEHRLCTNNWCYVRVCVDAVPFLRPPMVGVVLADHLCNVFDAASTTGVMSGSVSMLSHFFARQWLESS